MKTSVINKRHAKQAYVRVNCPTCGLHYLVENDYLMDVVYNRKSVEGCVHCNEKFYIVIV